MGRKYVFPDLHWAFLHFQSGCCRLTWYKCTATKVCGQGVHGRGRMGNPQRQLGSRTNITSDLGYGAVIWQFTVLGKAESIYKEAQEQKGLSFRYMWTGCSPLVLCSLDPGSQGAMNSSYYSSGNRASMGVNGMGGMSNMSNMSGGWGM